MSDRDDLGKAIFDMITKGKGGGDDMKPTESMGKQSEKLLRLFETFNNQDNFQPGDLITIKDGFKTWRTTSKDRVLVVIERLPEPRYGTDMGGGDETSVGTQYAAIRYDIVAGFSDENGNLARHFYDSRHFRKYKPSGAQKIVNLFGNKGE